MGTDSTESSQCVTLLGYIDTEVKICPVLRCCKMVPDVVFVLLGPPLSWFVG